MATGLANLLNKLGLSNKRTVNSSIPGESNSFLYPSDLFSATNPPYIIFVRRESVARGANVISKIALYMPPNISVNYGTSWEDIELNWYQYGDRVTDAWGILKTLNWKEAGRAAAVGGARIVDSVTGGDYSSEYELLATGRTKNPHQSLLFKGVNFREFRLEFNLMARNESESNSIRDLIKEFKLGMHPNIGDAAGDQRFLYFPDNFDIYFMTPAKDYMFNIQTCSLSNMNVSYAESGINSFFNSTGAPVHQKMTLEFKEFEPLTREKIQENY